MKNIFLNVSSPFNRGVLFPLVLLLAGPLWVATGCGDSDQDRSGTGDVSTSEPPGPGDVSTSEPPGSGDVPVWAEPYSDEALDLWQRCWRHTSQEGCNAEDDFAVMVLGERVEQCRWTTVGAVGPEETCWSAWSYCHFEAPPVTCSPVIVTRWVPDGDSGRFVRYWHPCYSPLPGTVDYTEGPPREDGQPLGEWLDSIPDACE